MNEGPTSTLETDVARVRLVLMRELETISLYEALAREASSPEIRAFFEHLAHEEKEHVAEATFLLGKLDAGQRAFLEKPFPEAHFAGAAPKAGAPEAAPSAPRPFIPEEFRLPIEPHRVLHALPAPPTLADRAFTVGSLKNRS